MNNKPIKYPNNKLKELRTKHGLLQQHVAKLLQLQCENRLSKWEHGQSLPNVENLFKLAQIYQVLPHELYPELFSEIPSRVLETIHITQPLSIDTE